MRLLSFLFFNAFCFFFLPCRCTMTWMYNPPQYIKIPMPSEIQSKFPRYNLFIYGEGFYAESLINMGEDIQLDGVPVVFVHGNAGRYKQV